MLSLKAQKAIVKSPIILKGQTTRVRQSDVRANSKPAQIVERAAGAGSTARPYHPASGDLASS